MSPQEASATTAATARMDPELREGVLARPLSRNFVLVTGGKGGVGKTTIAANLAIALGAASPKRFARAKAASAAFPAPPTPSESSGDPTAPDLHPKDGAGGGAVAVRAAGSSAPLLVDLDLGLANLELLLELEGGGGVEAFLAGERGIEDTVRRGPVGVGVLGAACGIGALARQDAARRERLVDGVAAVAPDYGIVIGDSPAGIGPDVLAFGAMADRVLIVTTPEPAARMDAYGLVKALDAHAREARVEVPTPELFVNQARDANEAREIADRLGGTCRRFLGRSPRLVGWMPRSRVVRQSIVNKAPFVLGEPRSLAARCMARLAQRFAALVGEPALEGAA